MKTRKQKEKESEKLREELAQVSTVILSTFQGIPAEQETVLRRGVESVGGHYRVVKNAVAERAAEGTAAESLLKGLIGPNAISYTAEDPVAFAKTLAKLAKEIPAIEFRAGLVEGRVVSVDELVALASLPSREALLTKIAFLVQSPIQRIAQALAGTARNLAVVTEEAAKAEKFAK
ncbi:MAG TPA: 50S ribosomal protein L10 [Candidatus Dormibacteraeota bacterium]|nr:50S ribosomal protein L10 [Candidatus Dormibacteraeota bacterium]